MERVPRLDETTALAVYRIFQEATANAMRHANATILQVFLGASDAALMLTVRDNGDGFDPAQQDPDSGVGLELMRQRARSIGATLEIESAPGRGTNLVLTVPLPPTDPAQGDSP
ncbi:MAG: hypothetical protein D6761_05800 [Candidatus Dadabacteria bacterium]|nr:MAG: hypothetical protein D6761_05800 [Candidatus Dadabacteria bacterium]